VNPQIAYERSAFELRPGQIPIKEGSRVPGDKSEHREALEYEKSLKYDVEDFAEDYYDGMSAMDDRYLNSFGQDDDWDREDVFASAYIVKDDTGAEEILTTRHLKRLSKAGYVAWEDMDISQKKKAMGQGVGRWADETDSEDDDDFDDKEGPAEQVEQTPTPPNELESLFSPQVSEELSLITPLPDGEHRTPQKEGPIQFVRPSPVEVANARVRGTSLIKVVEVPDAVVERAVEVSEDTLTEQYATKCYLADDIEYIWEFQYTAE
jgi:hypothetical protein